MDGRSMIPELDHEFAQTRRCLERLPTDKLDWKPHPKSFSLGHLAAHLAEIPRWVPPTLNVDEFELATYDRVVPETKDEILARFDEGLAEARRLIEAASTDDLATSWTMLKDGEVMLSMPKAAVLRGFILNHNVHHRAQLGVYLRLLDVPVPAIYGPSADEE